MSPEPAPAGTDPALVADFWSKAAGGDLHLQRCPRCARLRYFPAPYCAACLEPGGEWSRVSGRARVYSFTVVHRPPSATFAGEIPYVIGLLDLEEGVRVMARLDDCRAETLQAGALALFAGTRDSGAGPWLSFRLVESTAGPGT